ncbi:MAG: hypothetical protein SPF56_08660 [Bacteroidaceae bacterium]|nr:hypothetical protein [Bacteroidaceae bacterium]
MIEMVQHTGSASGFQGDADICPVMPLPQSQYENNYRCYQRSNLSIFFLFHSLRALHTIIFALPGVR